MKIQSITIERDCIVKSFINEDRTRIVRLTMPHQGGGGFSVEAIAGSPINGLEEIERLIAQVTALPSEERDMEIPAYRVSCHYALCDSCRDIECGDIEENREVSVTPEWHQHNGTPVCSECGTDMDFTGVTIG